ncbi:MAG: hypothetical protein ABI134_18615, partial [Byssovorax sp.]
RKDAREEKREAAKDAREEKRDDAKDAREEKREAAKDAREDKRDDAKDAREEKKEAHEAKHDQRAETRKDRREAHRLEVSKRWGTVLKMPEAAAELKVSARRLARLTRARAVAVEAGKTELVERADKLIARENERHTTAMERIKARGDKP